MTAPARGLAQSVQTRLVRHAKTLAVDPNLVLARYATERFLYRLSRSRHADRFILKGALLILAWLGETIRPTRDADFLGFGDLSEGALVKTFREILSVEVEDDGLTFDPSSIRVAAIRPEDEYGGRRVNLLARLGQARLRVQVDIGIGDTVEPEPEWLDYPSLLDLPRPRLRAYRQETAIAEKLHAMVVLGTKNSRMRDFFDVYALSSRASFDGAVLAGAIRATFERRRTSIPEDSPVALTKAFTAVEGQARSVERLSSQECNQECFGRPRTGRRRNSQLPDTAARGSARGPRIQCAVATRRPLAMSEIGGIPTWRRWLRLSISSGPAARRTGIPRARTATRR